MALIFIVLTMVFQCSLVLPSSVKNGTYDSLMFIENDVQCLAQMPIDKLMKIQKAIRMMHVVSAYDAHHPSNLTEINNDSQNQSDTRLRELAAPEAESRTLHRLFGGFTTSPTVQSPLAEAFMMPGQVHDTIGGSQLT